MDRRRAKRTMPMYNLYIYIYIHTHVQLAERVTFIAYTTHTLLMGRLIEEGGYDEKRLILYSYIGHGAK
jgi:hypothetical protein